MSRQQALVSQSLQIDHDNAFTPLRFRTEFRVSAI